MTTTPETLCTNITALADQLGSTSLIALIVTGGLALLIFGFVVLPAIWSRHPYRRRAAATVLQLILTFLRPSKTPRRRIRQTP